MSMKRMILSAFAALMTVTAFAQVEPVYTSPNGQLTFDIASHVGFGYHVTKSSAYTPGFSSEIFANIVKLGVYPVKQLGFELGVDIEGNFFTSKTSSFVVDSQKKVQAGSFDNLEDGNIDKTRGGFNFLTFNAPLLLKGIFGKVEIGVGAEASLNCLGGTYYRYRQGIKRVQVDMTDADINRFSYGIIASLSYDDAGVYFKYYPKGSQVLPDGSVDVDFVTVGIAFGF